MLKQRLLFIAICIMALPTFAFGDLVGHWKFDETSGLTASDSSATNNAGTLTNMAGTEWTGGMVNGALAFDGVDDEVRISDNAAYSFGDYLTLAAWVKMPTAATGGDVGVISKFAGGDLEFNFRINSTGYINFWGSQLGSSIIGAGITSAAALVDNTWTHVAGVYNDGAMTVYIDGAQSGGLLPGSALPLWDGSSDISIGAYSAGGANFPGTIDDVRIYNTALTEEEIAAIVPEPTTLALLGLGGLLMGRKRRGR